MKCPNCGFDDSAPAAKPWKNAMSMYVTEDGKDFGLMNDDAPSITVPESKAYPQGLVLTRKDLFGKKEVGAAAKAGAPSVETSKVPLPSKA